MSFFHTLRAAVIALAVVGCKPGSDGTAANTDIDQPPCNPCVLTDGNNFSYDSEIDTESFPLAEGQDNLVSWTGLTKSIIDEPIDPESDVVQAALVAFLQHSQEEVIEGLENGDIPQSWVSIYLTCEPIDASCHLSDFNFMGTSVNIQEYFTQEWGGTWLVFLSDGSPQGAQSLAFLEPAAIDATTAEIGSETATLTIIADLHSLEPITVEPLTTDITVDWSSLTKNGLGLPIDLYRIDRLMLARFDESSDEIEENFKRLEFLPEETWEIDVGELTSANLSSLVGFTTFGGVKGNSVYLLGLFCDSCTSPIPLFLTAVRSAG